MKTLTIISLILCIVAAIFSAWETNIGAVLGWVCATIWVVVDLVKPV